MTDTAKTAAPKITEIEPVETAGRETIARFQAQFRAAAYECLSILSGKTIDRVYCDYQDDFVSRRQDDGKPLYHFYQVKTKAQRNFQWDKVAVLGLRKRGKPKPEQMTDSFAGKLMVHTIRFKNSCGSVVFLTNVHFDDPLEEIAQALESGNLEHDALKPFMESFNEAFAKGDPLDEQSIKDAVAKLLLKPGIEYLHPHGHDFGALAREAIFKYSEVDLSHEESEEIIHSLVALVEKKSFKKVLATLSESDLDDVAGIGISDLLDILSISKGAYRELLEGGDASAIKSASIIQRKLSQAGATESMIEYCSKCKVQWDVWLRDKRHTLPEFDLNFLLEELNSVKNLLTSGKIAFKEIQGPINQLLAKVTAKGFTTLSADLLLGGVLSQLVRSEAQ
jgi:hypothetical protein